MAAAFISSGWLCYINRVKRFGSSGRLAKAGSIWFVHYIKQDKGEEKTIYDGII